MRNILASSVAVFWPLPNGSSARTAVAQTEIKIAIRPERQFAALVVPKRLRDLQTECARRTYPPGPGPWRTP